MSSFNVIGFIVMLLLVGCNSGSDESIMKIPLIKKPTVAKIAYGDSVIEESERYTDISRLRAEYASGDLSAGYFLGVALTEGFNVKKDSHEGINILEEVWSRGLVDSGFILYSIFYHGDGVEKQRNKALLYLNRSAELGYMPSQRKLGMIYSGYERSLLQESPELALKWFIEAARSGDRRSALNVAGMYRHGLGVKQNQNMAFKWLLKAIGKKYGNKTLGFSALGHYYENGIGTSVNLVLAYKYYDLLQPSADKDKARMIQKMTKQQISEGKELSQEWQNENNIHIIE